MTNDELREVLEDVLEKESITEDTIMLLLDAAIHACIISKLKELPQVASEFLGMCIGHNIMNTLLGANTGLEGLGMHDMQAPRPKTKPQEPADSVDHDARARSILDSAFNLKGENEE